MICNKCGKQMKDGVKFCPKCGTRQDAREPDSDGIPDGLEPERNKKSKQFMLSIIIAVCSAAVCVCLLFAYGILPPGNTAKDLPVTGDEAAEEAEDMQETNGMKDTGAEAKETPSPAQSAAPARESVNLSAEQTNTFISDVAQTLAIFADEAPGVTFLSPQDITTPFLERYLFVYCWEHRDSIIGGEIQGVVDRENYYYDGFYFPTGPAYTSVHLIPQERTNQLIKDAFGQEVLDSIDQASLYEGGYYVFPITDYNLWNHVAYPGGNTIRGETEETFAFSYYLEYIDGKDKTKEFYIGLEPDDKSRYGCMVTLFGSGEEETPDEAYPVDTSIFDSYGIIFSDSNLRYLNEAELLALQPSDGYTQLELLGFARNEIFARYGETFETPRYKNHYEQYDWYNQMPKVEDLGFESLNEYETANVQLIQAVEKKLGG